MTKRSSLSAERTIIMNAMVLIFCVCILPARSLAAVADPNVQEWRNPQRHYSIGGTGKHERQGYVSSRNGEAISGARRVTRTQLNGPNAILLLRVAATGDDDTWSVDTTDADPDDDC